MSDKMNESVMKAIQESLPEKVCTEIKRAIEENVELKAANEEQTKALDKLAKQAVEDEQRIKNLLDTIKYHKDLDERKKLLDEQERSLKVTKMEYEVKCLTMINENSMEILRNLSRNTVVKKDIHTSGSKDMPAGDGYGSTCCNHNNNTTVETTEE